MVRCRPPPGLACRPDHEELNNDAAETPTDTKDETNILLSCEQALMAGLECSFPWQWWWAIAYKIIRKMQSQEVMERSLRDFGKYDSDEGMTQYEQKQLVRHLSAMQASWEAMGAATDDSIAEQLRTRASSGFDNGCISTGAGLLSFGAGTAAAATGTSTGSGLFSFGAGMTTATGSSNGTGLFSFGAGTTAAATSTSTGSGLFSFGAGMTTATGTSNGTGLISFGAGTMAADTCTSTGSGLFSNGAGMTADTDMFNDTGLFSAGDGMTDADPSNT